MTEKDKGHYARKHPPHARPREEVLEALRSAGSEGRLSCQEAFRKAAVLGIPPSEVGVAADFLEIRIDRCQLGLFGYEPKKVVKAAQEVAPELDAAIRKALVNGRLPCAGAWAIAKEQGTAKMAVSSACEKLGIKISSCQLGAF